MIANVRDSFWRQEEGDQRVVEDNRTYADLLAAMLATMQDVLKVSRLPP